MSTFTHESMTNHHESGLFNGISETLHLWHERRRQRRQLSELNPRELHDVGLSWSDVVYEAEKPFWRA